MLSPVGAADRGREGDLDARFFASLEFQHSVQMLHLSKPVVGLRRPEYSLYFFVSLEFPHSVQKFHLSKPVARKSEYSFACCACLQRGFCLPGSFNFIFPKFLPKFLNFIFPNFLLSSTVECVLKAVAKRNFYLWEYILFRPDMTFRR